MQGKSRKNSGIKNPRSTQGKNINMELCNEKSVVVGIVGIESVLIIYCKGFCWVRFSCAVEY